MKVLLTIDGVSFYSTSTQIKKGVGQDATINAVAQDLLAELKDCRRKSGTLRKTVGCGGTHYRGHHAQIFLMGA